MHLPEALHIRPGGEHRICGHEALLPRLHSALECDIPLRRACMGL